MPVVHSLATIGLSLQKVNSTASHVCITAMNVLVITQSTVLWLTFLSMPVGPITCESYFLFCGATVQIGHRPLVIEVSISHKLQTLCVTPLNKWSARHRDATYKTHIKHERRTSMPSAWLEPAIPAIKWLVTKVTTNLYLIYSCTKSSVPWRKSVTTNLFSSLYFKTIGLPVSAKYSNHQAPQKTWIHETLLSLDEEGLCALYTYANGDVQY
jgi:hypothetical protein